MPPPPHPLSRIDPPRREEIETTILLVNSVGRQALLGIPRCALPVPAMSQQAEAGTRTHVTVSSRFLVCFDRLADVACFVVPVFLYLYNVKFRHLELQNKHAQFYIIPQIGKPCFKFVLCSYSKVNQRLVSCLVHSNICNEISRRMFM
jgi:hypothetical protein